MEDDLPYTKWSIEKLEKEYSPSRFSKRFPPDVIIAEHVKFIDKESTQIRQSSDCELDVPYGSTERQKLDIFGVKTLPEDSPVFVFIHGGYWQELRSEMYSYMAKEFIKSGAVCICVGYDLAPHANLSEIIEMVRQAMLHTMKWAHSRGSRGVYVSGSSAGGHLAAMVTATDWVTKYGIQPETAQMIKGAVLLSGVFDLRPLVKTYVNEPLKLTDEDAWEMSPLNHIDDIVLHCKHCKFLVAVGDVESSEFIRQSKQFHEALTKQRVSSKYSLIQGVDHFDMLEKFVLEDYSLLKEVLSLMGLSS